MAINNMMPPVQLKRPAAPVTDINEVIAALNMQLPEPSVQQAAPTSVNGVAEMLKNQLVNAALNSKIEALKDGIPLEQVTGQTQRPAPVMPVSNRTRLVDESPIHGSTSAATTAFAKTAQSMNNIKAMNEAINQDREYKQYQDTESLNRMIEKLDMQNQYARELEADKAQNRMSAQDAAFEDRMALLNARLDAKGSGRGAGRPAGSGASTGTPFPTVPSKEELDQMIGLEGDTKKQNFLIKKRDALYGKDSPFKMVFSANPNDPADGFEYGVLVDKKTGMPVASNGLMRKTQTPNAIQGMINEKVDPTAGQPAGPPQFGNQPQQPPATASVQNADPDIRTKYINGQKVNFRKNAAGQWEAM